MRESLLKFAFKLTGNQSVARELFYETLVRAYSKREAFDEKDNLKLQIFAIMRAAYKENETNEKWNFLC